MSKIVSAYMEICGLCNEHCPYCYNSKLVRTGNIIPKGNLIRVLNELDLLGVRSCTLSGGEPFLHPELSSILQAAKSSNIKILMISNGLCFSLKHSDLLYSFSPDLQITFDGFDSTSHDATRGKGNFNLITNGIMNLDMSSFSGQLHIRINLHGRNISQVQRILDMLDCLLARSELLVQKVAGISIAIVHKTGAIEDLNFTDYLTRQQIRRQEDLLSILELWNTTHTIKITYSFQNPDVGCPFNGDVGSIECGIRIAADGNVYPCQLFSDDRFCIGNIYLNSLTEIITGSKWESFVSLISNRHTVIEECSDCVYQSLCGKGCPAQAYIDNGTIFSVTDRCLERKQLFKDNILHSFQELRKSPNNSINS